jgi:hypothetical protein
VIYFKPEHDEHDYLLLLRKAIPEFFECTYNSLSPHVYILNQQRAPY